MLACVKDDSLHEFTCLSLGNSDRSFFCGLLIAFGIVWVERLGHRDTWDQKRRQSRRRRGSQEIPATSFICFLGSHDVILAKVVCSPPSAKTIEQILQLFVRQYRRSVHE
jgi:hypothetical protein